MFKSDSEYEAHLDRMDAEARRRGRMSEAANLRLLDDEFQREKNLTIHAEAWRSTPGGCGNPECRVCHYGGH